MNEPQGFLISCRAEELDSFIFNLNRTASTVMELSNLLEKAKEQKKDIKEEVDYSLQDILNELEEQN